MIFQSTRISSYLSYSAGKLWTATYLLIEFENLTKKSRFFKTFQLEIKSEFELQNRETAFTNAI